jgi:hypothetical protein
MSYWLVPFVLLAIVLLPQLIARDADALLASCLITPLWMAYVIKVGGDFMEFRFLVPMLPCLTMIIASAILQVSPRWLIRAALALAIIAGSVNHALTYDMLRHEDGRPESRQSLRAHLVDRQLDWVGIGLALARDLPGSDVRIAVTAAGAIPFYSRLPAVDMLGLNDRWVARHGEVGLRVPGHQRLAPLSYLIDRNVHLVLGHPQLVKAAERRDSYPQSFLSWIRLTDRGTVPLVTPLRVVEMPVDREYVAPVVYLTPHPDVDQLIASGKWRAVPIRDE